jgi:hypothetical protein
MHACCTAYIVLLRHGGFAACYEHGTHPKLSNSSLLQVGVMVAGYNFAIEQPAAQVLGLSNPNGRVLVAQACDERLKLSSSQLVELGTQAAQIDSAMSIDGAPNTSRFNKSKDLAELQLFICIGEHFQGGCLASCTCPLHAYPPLSCSCCI